MFIRGTVCMGEHTKERFVGFCLYLLGALDLSCGTQDLWSLSCGLWNPVPQPRDDWAPALGMPPWITRKSQHSVFRTEASTVKGGERGASSLVRSAQGAVWITYTGAMLFLWLIILFHALSDLTQGASVVHFHLFSEMDSNIGSLGGWENVL